MNIEEIASELLHIGNTSTNALVQSKVAKALSNIKRARAFTDKAEATLKWARREHGKTLVELAADGKL